MSEQSAAAGWYRDGAGALRWWDGAGWTAHVAPEPAAVQVPVDPVPTPGRAPAGGAFRPEPTSYDVGGTTLAATTVPHRSAAVLDAYYRPQAPAVPVSYYRAPKRDVGQGVLLILIAVLCAAGCAVTYLIALPNGGLVWTGGAFVAVALGLRGFAELARPGTRTHRKLTAAAVTAADPWAAHQAARATAARGPSNKQFVSGWVVLACLVGTVAVVAVVVLWPTGSPNAVSAAPVPAAHGAVTKPAATKPAVKKKAAPVVRDTGPWVPRDRKHVWTSVGTTFAYSDLGPSMNDCAPGTTCSRLLVASKHACSALRVRVQFVTFSGRSITSSVVARHVRAGKPVEVWPSVSGATAQAFFSSMRCLS